MLDVCGIQNVDIVKSDTSHSAHYWSLINLGDGWYHFDATPRKGGGNFFMLTDAELAAYSTKHKIVIFLILRCILNERLYQYRTK